MPGRVRESWGAAVRAIRNTLTAVVAAGAAVAVLTGCGGDKSDASAPIVRPVATTSAYAGPYAELTGRQLMDRALTAMKAAPSMTVDLRTTDDTGTPVHMTAAVTRTGKCAAAVRLGPDQIQLIRVGSMYYVKADAHFWKQQGAQDGLAMARALAGKWLKVPSAVGGQDFDHVCDLATLLSDITEAGTDSTVAKGHATTLGGQPVVPLVQHSSNGDTDLFVAAGATPYVLKAYTPHDSSNLATFTGFGRAAHISAPPPGQTVDISAFGDLDGISI